MVLSFKEAVGFLHIRVLNQLRSYINLEIMMQLLPRSQLQNYQNSKGSSCSCTLKILLLKMHNLKILVLQLHSMDLLSGSMLNLQALGHSLRILIHYHHNSTAILLLKAVREETSNKHIGRSIYMHHVLVHFLHVFFLSL